MLIKSALEMEPASLLTQYIKSPPHGWWKARHVYEDDVL